MTADAPDLPLPPPLLVREKFEGDEHDPIPVPLALLFNGGKLDVYPQVFAKNYFSIRLDKDELTFAAGNHIGLIPINDRVEIEVHPKLPVRNFTRLLAVSEQVPYELPTLTRDYIASDYPLPSIIDLLAKALTEAVKDIEGQGVLREYQRRSADTSFPKGRILAGETLTRHVARSVSHRVAATWHERSADVGPNRLIKYALFSLAHKYNAVRNSKKGARAILSKLNEAYKLFHGVGVDHSRAFFTHPLVRNPAKLPSTRAYYSTPIRLALAILQEKGVDFDVAGSHLRLDSLLLNMEKVLEAYVRNVLRIRFGDLPVDVLNGNLASPEGVKKQLFNGGEPPPATPDILIRPKASSGVATFRPVLVEVKYKRYEQLPDRDDLNQAITYAVSYATPTVVLMHPLGTAQKRGPKHLGTVGSIDVYRLGVDLAASDPEVEEKAFSDEIRGLVEVKGAAAK